MGDLPLVWSDYRRTSTSTSPNDVWGHWTSHREEHKENARFLESELTYPMHGTVICHRLFFAVKPPLILARRVTESALWFGPDSKPLRPEHLHLTLCILDDFAAFPDQVGERLIEVAASVTADPFLVMLDQVVGSARSIALRPRRRNAALHSLAERIGAALSGAGVAQREGYRFSPHLTLSYRRGQPFSRTIEPVSWRVDEFVLVHSLVGRTRHEVLGRWPLRGIDPDQYGLL